MCLCYIVVQVALRLENNNLITLSPKLRNLDKRHPRAATMPIACFVLKPDSVALIDNKATWPALRKNSPGERHAREPLFA